MENVLDDLPIFPRWYHIGRRVFAAWNDCSTECKKRQMHTVGHIKPHIALLRELTCDTQDLTFYVEDKDLVLLA